MTGELEHFQSITVIVQYIKLLTSLQASPSLYPATTVLVRERDERKEREEKEEGEHMVPIRAS